MQTSAQLLASIADKKRWSFKRIAKELGQSHKMLDEIRHAQQCFSEEQSSLVAKWLELNPLYILACPRAERTKRKGLKTLWERIARDANAT